MPMLSNQLILDSCPHCGRANPTFALVSTFIKTETHNKENRRWWAIYACRTCGGVVTAGGDARPEESEDPIKASIDYIYPSISTISDAIPQKPREFLKQAQNSLHAPSASIMVSASAVDAMLKKKDYTDGSLYDRIDQAAKDHVITDEMAKWAHQIRLDANEQRHADENVGLPTNKDAKLTFDFAIAFAEYLFVLPSRVTRGITDTQSPKKAT